MGFIGVILGLQRVYIGIMDKKMEATVGPAGVCCDDWTSQLRLIMSWSLIKMGKFVVMSGIREVQAEL